MKKLKLLIKKSKILIIALAVLFVTVSFYRSSDDKNFEMVKNLDIFYSLFRELNIFYVDDVSPAELVKRAIDSMLASLDPYTVFIPESQMEDLKLMTTGEYGGVGALIRQEGDYVVISEPYEGFPAQKNDLRAGDIILEIDGNSIKGRSTSDVSELLKGQPNTSLTILIKRPGEEINLSKTLIREEIKIDNVPYSGFVEEGIAYVNLSNFTDKAGNEVKKALLDLKAKGNIKGIILDLRSNPGGLLHEAVNVSNLFINKGEVIVSTKGKVKDWDKSYQAQNQPFDLETPIVVMVNSASASASEIVAGAVQDLDRGLVIGQRTFGKGLVQTTRDLSYKSKLKVTTAKYYTPSGRCIQVIDYSHRNPDGSAGKVPDSLINKFNTRNGREVFDGGGIIPDIVFEQDSYSNIAISLLSKNLIFNYATQFRLKNDTIPSAWDFKVDDKIYADFVDFLADKDYDYTTRSDELLKRLIATAKEEKYYDHAKEEFNILEKQLGHDKDQDLQTFKIEISQLLEEEIISRYYYQKGRLESFLKNDKEIKQAIEILNDKGKYKNFLIGNK